VFYVSRFPFLPFLFLSVRLYDCSAYDEKVRERERVCVRVKEGGNKYPDRREDYFSLFFSPFFFNTLTDMIPME